MLDIINMRGQSVTTTFCSDSIYDILQHVSASTKSHHQALEKFVMLYKDQLNTTR
jgi:hypothetical protein